MISHVWKGASASMANYRKRAIHWTMHGGFTRAFKGQEIYDRLIGNELRGELTSRELIAGVP
jgi:hypothetical protein